MPTSSSHNAKPFLVNGLLVKRLHIAPDINVILRNVIRLLVLNQAAFLTEQETLSGLTAGSLPPIPEAQFGASDQVNYNQLHCLVIGVRNSRYEKLPRTDEYIVQISFPVKSKTGQPILSRQLADAYTEAYQSILDTAFMARSREFTFGFVREFDLSDLSFRVGVDLKEGTQRQISSTPFLEMRFSLEPQTQFN